MHILWLIGHWFLTVTGSNNPSDTWYGFWSGFAGDLPEFVILGIIYHRLNCHADGCKRIGVHHVAGTHYVTCRHHHPDYPGSGKATVEQIAHSHAMWKKHKEVINEDAELSD